VTVRGFFLDRLALRVMQFGAIAVVLAALPFKSFDLDRFFVPKELVLHVIAFLALLMCVVRQPRWSLARVDQLLGWFVVLSAFSAILATNLWLAQRALAITLSGVACFWAARALARAGYREALINAVAIASVVGAATALLQTYGLRTEYFSLNRAPGGTFGNRNFMAHIAAIAMPALVWSTIFASTRATYLRWSVGLSLVSAALMLSRSRAAWLALILCALVTLPLGLATLRGAEGAVRGGRVAMLPIFAAAGVGLALLLPNTLDWRSDSPYLDTAKSVVNYKEGSGRGRIVQYTNTLRMSVRHPLLGVGPGNWAVQYPAFAQSDDPSMSSEGMTANPWPSSDWMSFLSERGLAAFVLLMLALTALVADAARAVRNGATAEDRLAGCALLGTVVVLLVVGSFDAVLLLPAPAFVAWSLLGALSPVSRERAAVEMPVVKRLLALIVIAAIGGALAVRSLNQATAMALFSGTNRASTLEKASVRDPGSYRIHIRLADGYLNRGNCAKARAHANAARALYPRAPQPRRVLAECGR
jgi:O-antigen ligase